MMIDMILSRFGYTKFPVAALLELSLKAENDSANLLKIWEQLRDLPVSELTQDIYNKFSEASIELLKTQIKTQKQISAFYRSSKVLLNTTILERKKK